MKKIFFTFIIIAFGLNACNKKQDSEDTSKDGEEATGEIVEIEKADAFFGETFSADEELTLEKLEAKMNDQDSVLAVVEAKVREVCQSKGCWMKVELPNGESMRVTFKDYGFFMPKDLAGTSVIMNGIAKKEETDVETLKHFAEDAGKSKEEIEKINKPKMDYKFVASGVKVVK